MFDSNRLKSDFPILAKRVHGKRLVYLDNAATSHKPRAVIHAITGYYKEHNANVHRGVHQLGDESTHIFHDSRKAIAHFFGAKPQELITVRNTTEAINQIVYMWGEALVKEGDEIIVSELEHHSNFVPWQVLAKKKQAKLVIWPLDEHGLLDQAWLDAYDFKSHHVAFVAFSHVSNTLGSFTDVKVVAQKIKSRSPETLIVIDGAQAAPHLPVDFFDLDIDFYTMSAHKMLGPMGIGGLLVRESLLKTAQPWLLGGGMIDEVTWTDTSYAEDLEERFTAGTPDVASLAGWAAACSYLAELNMNNVLSHDQDLVQYALDKLAKVPEIKLIGPRDATQRIGSVAFIYDGVHAHDVGQILDSEGVAVRSGHHCTMPLHTKHNWQASVRASFQVYTTKSDIDALVTALAKVKQVFKK